LAHRLKPEVHWSRAVGYLELEMFVQVGEELDMLPEDQFWRKRKSAMVIEISQRQKNWVKMRQLAEQMRHKFPDEPSWWVAEAYATRRSLSLIKARDILLDGLVHHYEDATIRYNLACYACLLGSLGECLDFLKEAVSRDERYKKMAMEDEDLEAVRDALRSLGWDEEGV